MDTILHLNALLKKNDRSPITDDEAKSLWKKIIQVVESENYMIYGKEDITSEEKLNEKD